MVEVEVWAEVKVVVVVWIRGTVKVGIVGDVGVWAEVKVVVVVWIRGDVVVCVEVNIGIEVGIERKC